jgi:DNA-binding GntR family transcriptional regulator
MLVWAHFDGGISTSRNTDYHFTICRGSDRCYLTCFYRENGMHERRFIDVLFRTQEDAEHAAETYITDGVIVGDKKLTQSVMMNRVRFLRSGVVAEEHTRMGLN